MRIWFFLIVVMVFANPSEATDFFTSYADRALEEANAALKEANDRHLRTLATIGLSPSATPNVFAPSDQGVLRVFEDAAVRYNFPVDVLLAMAEKDSGFNPLARSLGPGPKTRGIINMTDEDVAREGINPYLPDQAINVAAKKLRGYLNFGMTI